MSFHEALTDSCDVAGCAVVRSHVVATLEPESMLLFINGSLAGSASYGRRFKPRPAAESISARLGASSSGE